MPSWDVLMVCVLLYTALWTPYEITFLEEANVLRDPVKAVEDKVSDLWQQHPLRF